MTFCFDEKKSRELTLLFFDILTADDLTNFLFCRWNFVVGLMPMWLAPNLITMLGLAVNVLTSLVHLYFCPTAKEEVRNESFEFQ